MNDEIRNSNDEAKMVIVVKFFAALRERAGTSQATMRLSPGASISQAAEQLARQYPTIKPHLPKIAYAINEHYSPTTTELHDGDELALLPPVSGG